jgi:hypothetical protein
MPPRATLRILAPFLMEDNSEALIMPFVLAMRVWMVRKSDTASNAGSE